MRPAALSFLRRRPAALRPLAVLPALLLGISAAAAQPLPNALAMSCEAARALVRQSGVVVLATGPDLYERIVTGQRFCMMQQTTAPAWIPTQDQKQCLVGRRCQERWYWKLR
ncbi:hypothetical protein [Ancylobacter lacus]|uniref:hypothetical protein n=1 Tax=Ancylobacter lacus TaxID=2579970 RepID=UPI001FE97C2C|nr:hypothetical protein [Ancylobacter lacus]